MVNWMDGSASVGIDARFHWKGVPPMRGNLLLVGESCGSAEGRSVYLVNGDSSAGWTETRSLGGG